MSVEWFPILPTEQAIERLLYDKAPAIADRARRLGVVMWQNVDRANSDPEIWTPPDDDSDDSDDSDTRFSLPTPERRVARKMSAQLFFLVSTDFEHLRGTADWLPKTHELRLKLGQYAAELPVNMDEVRTDPVTELSIRISAAPEYQTPAGEPREQRYVASYYDGSRLGPEDTEELIGTLTFLAGLTAAEADRPPEGR